jgi:hypothetical protein
LADEDRAFRVGPKRLRVRAARLRHPIHIAVTASGEIFLKPRARRPIGANIRHAESVEA